MGMASQRIKTPLLHRIDTSACNITYVKHVYSKLEKTESATNVHTLYVEGAGEVGPEALLSNLKPGDGGWAPAEAMDAQATSAHHRSGAPGHEKA